MTALHVKGLPDSLYEKLKLRAKQERRSVAQEVTVLLADTLQAPAEIRAAWGSAPRMLRHHHQPPTAAGGGW